MTSVENADEGRAWSWTDDAGDVVVPDHPPVAVYVNPEAAVVVRQRAHWPDEDDPWIWFAPQHAPAIAAAILEAAGLDATAMMLESTQVGSKASDKTAAGRQRRYRERKKKDPAIEPDLLDRNARDDRDVAERNGVTRDSAS